MHAVVSGGAGFIGARVARRLLDAGVQVTVVDNLLTGARANVPAGATFVHADVGDEARIDSWLAGADVLIHLAARTSVPESFDQPREYMRDNVQSVWGVLAGMERNDVTRIVAASSAAVYGEREGPCREADTPNPTSPYGLTKLINEHQLRIAAEQRGISCTSLRLFNVYGQGQDPHGPYASVIPKFVHCALNGQPLTVHGDGLQTRDFIHVDDVADAFIHSALTREPIPGVYNVGTGCETSVNQVAEQLRAVGTRVEVNHASARTGDVTRSVADTSKLAARGWSARIPIQGGLVQTYQETARAWT